jgi:putative pyruvate formate lyase activating enzyme
MDYLWASHERLDRARTHDRECLLCEHRCGVDRQMQRGPCKAGLVANVFRHRIEYGEELELVPSHLFYLSGCDLRCVFCIAGINAFDPARGTELTSDFFNEAVSWGIHRGARNVQWVGGEPTIHIPRILEVMAQCPALPPVVWKSDFYGTPEAFELLDGAIGVYVADFKFGNDACAQRLAGVKNYVSVVSRNLQLVASKARLIVRHLLLPGHEGCCYRPIVQWLRAHLPHVPLSLRDSYLPSWRSHSVVELSQPLKRGAALGSRRFAQEAGLHLIE